jgi:hypothetical protein
MTRSNWHALQCPHFLPALSTSACGVYLFFFVHFLPHLWDPYVTPYASVRFNELHRRQSPVSSVTFSDIQSKLGLIAGVFLSVNALFGLFLLHPPPDVNRAPLNL